MGERSLIKLSRKTKTFRFRAACKPVKSRIPALLSSKYSSFSATNSEVKESRSTRSVLANARSKRGSGTKRVPAYRNGELNKKISDRLKKVAKNLKRGDETRTFE
jgi:hypothetical protein